MALDGARQRAAVGCERFVRQIFDAVVQAPQCGSVVFVLSVGDYGGGDALCERSQPCVRQISLALVHPFDFHFYFPHSVFSQTMQNL